MNDLTQMKDSIVEIRKRNGKVTSFNKDKISNAIYKALSATTEADRELVRKPTCNDIGKLVEHRFHVSVSSCIEDIQDMVESILIDKGHSNIAKSVLQKIIKLLSGKGDEKKENKGSSSKSRSGPRSKKLGFFLLTNRINSKKMEKWFLAKTINPNKCPTKERLLLYFVGQPFIYF